MKTNASKKIHTHEGAIAKHINPESALRRSVLSCMLWEKEFYEDGIQIADRIMQNAALCSKEFVSKLAIEARNEYGLRHAPLMLLLDLIRRGGHGVSDSIADTIKRPDEMGELLSLYWRNGRCPLSKQLQRGLAKAFTKFTEYQLAKYDRDTASIKIRDVLFLSHAKPLDEKQAKLFKRVAKQKLKTPDTWEVGLSGGGDKKETFERLIKEKKLGYLALIRNLRNMDEAKVDGKLVVDAIVQRRGANLVFPFRYVAAARATPKWEPALDVALCAAIDELPRLKGKTAVLVDVSGSMSCGMSTKSGMTRMDAAATLASVINAEQLRVFSFSHRVVEVPPRRGMAGVDAVIKSQIHGGTMLGNAVKKINGMDFDRLIVITDEQSHDRVPDPAQQYAYMINVASYQNGVGYGPWTHLDGFSENVIRWIYESERNIER